MASLKLLFIFSTLLMFHLLISTAQQQRQPVYGIHYCGSTNYTEKSSFPENLKKTLSTLIANAAEPSNHGFFNTSTGNGSEISNGFFLCRGDITPELCQVSVKKASEDVINRCPMQMEAIIWYDLCMVRYSNRSIFSTREEKETQILQSDFTLTYSLDKFNDALGTLMKDLIRRACVKSKKMYAVGEVSPTPFNKLYGIAQCTPDLSSTDCNICLDNAVTDLPKCCERRYGARVLKPSCYIWYESFLFYDTVVALLSPSQLVLTTSNGEDGGSRKTIIIIVVPIVVAVVLVFTLFLYLKAKKKYSSPMEETNVIVAKDMVEAQSLQFDLETIEIATNNFSNDNKIGKGGFGVVYKGELSNGQEIAVKRLFTYSEQVAQEFKNEVLVVAKLQHRNLVRLLGFCLEKSEKILIFEFVRNRSLDHFLFDSKKQRQLNWSRRYKIIRGIARGILYLHEDSRLKIIHRDLKAANILLDENMNPKISDFGMARIFGVDQTKGNTKKIAGTFGYISPEYGMHGHFSMKSDVYSFGVLLLEVLSGKKNTSFYKYNLGRDLLNYAWKLWKNARPLELMDSTLMVASLSRTEVIRCIHIGLLCVQEDAIDRPNMATIVLMLNSHSSSLPLPRKPAFYIQTPVGFNMQSMDHESDPSTSKSTVNEMSITDLYPR